MIDSTITVANLLTAAFALAAIIGGYFVVRYKVSAGERKITDLEADMKATRARVEEVRAKGANELAEFKLQVAKEYATQSLIAQIEERVISEIHSLREAVFDNMRARPTTRKRGDS